METKNDLELCPICGKLAKLTEFKRDKKCIQCWATYWANVIDQYVDESGGMSQQEELS